MIKISQNSFFKKMMKKIDVLEGEDFSVNSSNMIDILQNSLKNTQVYDESQSKVSHTEFENSLIFD